MSTKTLQEGGGRTRYGGKMTSLAFRIGEMAAGNAVRVTARRTSSYQERAYCQALGEIFPEKGCIQEGSLTWLAGGGLTRMVER